MTVRARMLRSHPPEAAGVFNVCLFAPLFGLDLMGRKRAAR
jgi:hypothetical protein